MLSIIALGNLPGVVGFRVMALLEADGEGPHWFRQPFGHERHNDRGVNATAQKGAKWHLRDQPPPPTAVPPANSASRAAFCPCDPAPAGAVHVARPTGR